MSPNNRVLRVGLAIGVGACLVLPQVFWYQKNRSRSRAVNLYRRTCEAVAAIPAGAGDHGFFRDVTDQLGIDFHHVVGPLGTFFMPEINGAGGALFDFDNDGDLDLFFVNSGRSPVARGDFPPGTTLGNRLFRQEIDGTFSDVTNGSGLEGDGYGVGCAVGDVDNDGDLDLFVTHFGPDRLYRNNGSGTFTDVSQSAGINDDDYGTCAAFFDYDRDGWLDLMVVNYVHDPARGLSVACDYGRGQLTYCGPRKFVPTDARLYHNEGAASGAGGNGTPQFSDVTAASGLSNTPGTGFGVSCADFNGDGLDDIYVGNDMMPNRLWINRGNGTFTDEAVVRGAAYNGRGEVQASMGIALGDVNEDGAFDLLATHFAEEASAFFLNDGSGSFLDQTDVARITGPTRLHTGWGAAFVDVDHDGHLDLVLANGLVVPCHLVRTDSETVARVHRQEIHDVRTFWKDYADRNLILMNDGRGRFEDASALGGEFCTSSGSARALICGDIDNDGDVDLVVTYCGDRARVFRNDAPKRGRWLQVRAFDAALQRDACGAEVTVEAGGRRLKRLASPAYSYLASNDLRVHFGLGKVDRYDKVTIRWPDGTFESFSGGSPDRMVVLNRGSGRLLQRERK